jgi:hypothetical protein
VIVDPFFLLLKAAPLPLILHGKGNGGGIAVVSVPLTSLAYFRRCRQRQYCCRYLAMDAVALWSFRGQWTRLI